MTWIDGGQIQRQQPFDAGAQLHFVVHDFEPGYDTYTEKPGYSREADTAFADVDPSNYVALVIPGGRVFFLASDGTLALDIAGRMEAIGVHPRLVNRHYLEAMLSPDRLADIGRAIARPASLNTDQNPVLYYYELRRWLSQFGGFSAVLGAMLALAADRAYAMSGVVLNPHYRSMGELYGSEYWTYTLPRRVGEKRAAELETAGGEFLQNLLNIGKYFLGKFSVFLLQLFIKIGSLTFQFLEFLNQFFALVLPGRRILFNVFQIFLHIRNFITLLFDDSFLGFQIFLEYSPGVFCSSGFAHDFINIHKTDFKRRSGFRHGNGRKTHSNH